MEPDKNSDEAVESKPFEMGITAKAEENGIQTKLSMNGTPSSDREAGAAAINLAARALAFLYEGALIGSGREDTPTEQARFFVGMQPAVMQVFMGIADSWQFRKTLVEHRELAEKRKKTDTQD